MTYKELRGNLFSTKASTLVNTVNCAGVMGKGIALEFRRRYPEMYSQYVDDCKAGKLKPGNIYPYPVSSTLILNFTVKNHWRYPSRIVWIESCLRSFSETYKQMGITSVAFPWMGANSGGIPISTIKHIMRDYLKSLQEVDIEVYDFDIYAPDYLFNRLVDVINAPRAVATLKLSGIKEESCQKIIDAYNSGQVKSLAHLAEGGVVSDLSIDKLYVFLSSFSSTQNVKNNNSQPTLF